MQMRALSFLYNFASRLLSLAICASLVAPSTGLAETNHSRGPSSEPDLTAEEIKSIRTLQDLISRAESPSEVKESQLSEALKTAYTLMNESDSVLKSISIERKELVDGEGKPRDSASEARLKELDRKGQIASIMVNELSQFVGRHGGEFSAAFLVDPSDRVDENNVKTARFSLPAQTLTDADRETSSQQKSRIDGLINAGGSAAMNFSNQYVTYSIAMGVIALAQLQFADASNPNAIELWVKQTTDLMGAAGFAIFMATSHKVTTLLHRARNGTISPSMIPYIGMAAGSLAQSYFSDFMNDKNVWKCVRPYYNKAAKSDSTSCQKAKETWIAGQRAKILQYAPTVISMLGSVPLAGMIRKAIGSTNAAQSLSKKYLRLVTNGAKLVHKNHFARMATRWIAGAPVAIGDFVLFISIDIFFLHEPVNEAWQNLRMHQFDAKAFLDRRFGLYSEILFPKEGAYQVITDAFDVEATNLRSSHDYMMDMLNFMQKTKWSKPIDTKACTPKEVADGIKDGKLEQLKDLWFWQRSGSRIKGEAQLRCEIYSRPGDLLSRYADVNKEWRGILLTHYSTGQMNWLSAIEQFSTVYEASYLLAKHLAKLKADAAASGSSARPDLSREALAKVINTTLPSGDANEDRPTSVHGSKFNKTLIPTPELIDYVIAGFACGPSPVSDAKAQVDSGVISKLFDALYSLFVRQTESPAYITTAYGSSLRFTPPKLTTKSAGICVVAPGRAIQNPFKGPFFDYGGNGKAYDSLADFVYDHLEPSLHQKIGISTSFENWWTEHLRNRIAPVWDKYTESYERLISHDLVPVLFERTFQRGCEVAGQTSRSAKADNVDEDGFRVASGSQKDSPANQRPQTLTGRDPKQPKREVVCADSAAAYRVGRGVFLAIETEQRNYLRALFTMYAAALDGSTDIENRKTAFLQLANQIIDNTKNIDEKSLRSEDHEARFAETDEILAGLMKLVEVRVIEAGGVYKDFRLDMLKKIKEQLQKVSTEQLQHASAFHALNFSNGSSARARAKTLNSGPGSASNNRPATLPGQRHGN